MDRQCQNLKIKMNRYVFKQRKPNCRKRSDLQTCSRHCDLTLQKYTKSHNNYEY